MTQVKLWQIVSNTPNGMIWSDANGNIITIPQGAPNQVLIINVDGQPQWVANTALSTALAAQIDAANAITTANAYTETQIAALVDGAPIALNTLNELAQKLANEDSAIAALILQVDQKADSADVTTEVAQAKQEAITESATHTDTAVSAALVTAAATSLGQATDARNQAQTAAAINTANRVEGLRLSIPDTFRVEGTSLACFVADSSNLTEAEVISGALHVRNNFTEISGANTSAVDSSLVVKMLFINGVAIPTPDWSTTVENGHVYLGIDPAVATHMYDGSQNSVMLLAEYKSYGTIKLIPAPVV